MKLLKINEFAAKHIKNSIGCVLGRAITAPLIAARTAPSIATKSALSGGVRAAPLGVSLGAVPAVGVGRAEEKLMFQLPSPE